MALKEVNKDSPKWHFFVYIILTILFLIFVFYFYLSAKFSPGDLVYKKSDVLKIGEVKALNAFRAGYLILWRDGSYSVEFVENIAKLADIEDLNDTYNELNKSDNTNNPLYYQGFKQESNFEDYSLENAYSDSGVEKGSGVATLVYKGATNFSFNITKNCTPEFFCEDWSSCHTDYNLKDIIERRVLFGVQYKRCVDSKDCFPDIIDSRICINSQNISVRTRVWCGENQTEILDLTTNKIVARLNTKNTLNYVDINLNLISEGSCYYCFDKKKNYDETGRDCGGSCKPC